MNINSNAVVQSVISANTDKSISCKFDDGTIVELSDSGIVFRNMPGTSIIFAITIPDIPEMCYAYWRAQNEKAVRERNG